MAECVGSSACLALALYCPPLTQYGANACAAVCAAFMERFREDVLTELANHRQDAPLGVFRQLAELHVQHKKYDDAMECVKQYVMPVSPAVCAHQLMVAVPLCAGMCWWRLTCWSHELVWAASMATCLLAIHHS